MSIRYHCSQCSEPLGPVEILLPDEAWQAISRGDYALCPKCMDGRLFEIGMKVTGIAVFRGRALTTEITPETQLALGRWVLPEFLLKRA